MKDQKIFKSALDGTFELTGELAGAEEIITAGNSFFDRSYFGTRILIIAPKPGDEILIAGNMILNLSAAKAEIFIAYNSKKLFNAEVWKILGLKNDKIIYFKDADELKKNILDLRANVIFCADYDSQTEYKNLSETFDTVLGQILREEKNYRPEVYGFLRAEFNFDNSPQNFRDRRLQLRYNRPRKLCLEKSRTISRCRKLPKNFVERKSSCRRTFRLQK